MYYGWRGRIGHITPTMPIDTTALEYQPITPRGVVMAFATLGIEDVTDDDQNVALARVKATALSLARNKCDVVSLGGLPSLAPPALAAEIQAETGLPTLALEETLAEALRHLKIQRLVLVSPLGERVTADVVHTLEAHKFSVVHVKRLSGVAKPIDVSMVPFHTSYRLTMDASREAPMHDGLLVFAPRWPVVRNIAQIERDARRPVVASAPAVVWRSMRALGLQDSIKGFGVLLESIA